MLYLAVYSVASLYRSSYIEQGFKVYRYMGFSQCGVNLASIFSLLHKYFVGDGGLCVDL